MTAHRIAGFRLSPLQRRIRALMTSGAGEPLRVEALIAVHGRVDGQALAAAAAALARDHEILRTRFVDAGGDVLQCVADASEIPVECLQIPAALPEAVWSRVRTAGRAEGAGVDRLSEIVLVAGAERDYVYVSLSPLVADRRSAWLIARELMDRCAGRLPARAPDSLQYADIAEWKHALLESEEADGRHFWTSFRIDERLSRSLDCVRGARTQAGVLYGCARGSGVRLPPAARPDGAADAPEVEATALACWAYQCAQQCPEDAILIGVVSDGRAEAETAECIGPMTATLPIVVDLDASESVARCRARLADRLASARGWQDLFEWERVASTEGGQAPPPFCRVAFEHFDETLEAQPGASWTLDDLRADVDRYELKLVCVRRGGTLATRLDYDRAAVPDDEASRLVLLFERLLAEALRDPEQSLAAVFGALEPEARRACRMLRGPVETALVHELVEHQARATPDAIAVIDGDAQLTFGELNRRANRTARHLRDLGLAADEPVGIRLSRGSWTFVAVLGVLKAGGAFVPLDGSPKERLRGIIGECRLRIVFAEDGDADVWDAPVRIVTPATYAAAIARLPASHLHAPVCGENLAYVLFTSGSTGAPKGVMVPHAAVANYLRWARAEYDRAGTAGTIWHSPLDFDFTVTAFFLPLVCGRAVGVAPAAAMEWLSERLSGPAGLTFVKLTPSHLRALRDAAPCHPAATRLLVAGGERLTTADLRWLAAAPETVVVNEYGPTEAAVGCCVFHAPAGRLLDSADGDVPIGRPIWNTTLQVRTSVGALALPGARGELAIGGRGLARGYLGRPDLTAAAFRPDAQAVEPGARTYRTGDLVRLLPGGDLVYLGRADDQVKLRGFRIELNEIAETARQLPWVVESAVILTGDPPDARLALVVRAEPPARFDEDELRSFLARRLPSYMVPAAVARVDAIPLTAHGKVDARAVARTALARTPADHRFRAPATGVELDLAEIWQTVLGRAAIGADENFFTAGGDSIRSIQVLGLAKRRGYTLALADILEAPTIAQLATRVGTARAEVVPPDVRAPFALLSPEDRARVPAGVEDAYPMTAMQEGMLFHSEWDAHAATYHDIVGVHLEAPYDRPALESCLRAVVASHAVLRTVFDLHRFSQPMQLVLRTADVVLEDQDLRGAPGPAQEAFVEAWMAAEKERRFAWHEAPPYRLCVQRRGDDSFQFTIGFHHALLDGWSTASLLLELLTRYAAACGRTTAAVPLPPRSLFRDYVFLERAARRSVDSRTFWMRELEDAPPTLCGRALPDVCGGVSRHERPVRPDVACRLSALAGEWGVPLKSVLLAAHVKVIATLAGGAEVVTGVVGNGRVDDVDGERALGLFLNTLPLRARIREASWRALVRELSDCDARWASHRRFPLSDVLRALGVTALFDTAFNFVHYHIYRTLPAMPGLRVVRTRAFEETSFALLASFVQSGAADRLTLLLDADATRVRAGSVPGIADLYEAALHALASNPDASAWDCNIVPARLEAMRPAPAAAEPPRAAAARVDERVRDCAARVPDAAAVVAGEAHLSYAALVRLSGVVAGWLARHGIGADQIVALDLDRGLDLMVMCLATLRAGAAYVYLDRSLPDERRTFILRDSRPRLLVTDREAGGGDLEAGTPTWSARALMADARALAAPPPRRTPDPVGTALAAACYLVYTSGSTGAPKGIVMPHRPVAELIAWQIESAAGRAPRTLQYTTLAFDVSFQEIYSTWGAGGTLVLMPAEFRDEPLRLWHLLQQEEVERMFLPCAALRQLAAVHAHASASDRLVLSEVITAGDALHITPDVASLLAHLPGTTLTNQYGPAETHVVTALTLEGATGAWPARPSIGRGVAAAGAYLLNDRLRPVPKEWVGEIYIGGDAVGRGYLNRPDLTAERFVPDPYDGRPGARMYRTGDLARLEDGVFEFLGRRDHQVKVLGHRVELGEIESVIERLPDAAAAAVDRVVMPDGESQLVAYVVVRGNPDGAIDRVRAQLGRMLPRYMVPSRFVVLDALPRTISGKVDRQRLPRASGGAARPAPPVPAADATEAAILGIWERSLQRDGIGVEDDFFEAGGHSLAATRIVVGVRAALGVSLPIKAVFDLRSVRGMAREVSARARNDQAIVPRVPRDDRLVLAFQQETYWLHEHLAGSIHPNNIHIGLRLPGPLHPWAVEQALAALQRRHEALRTAFVVGADRRPRPAITPAEACSLRLETIDLSHVQHGAQEQALRRVSERERSRPFDLTRGAFWRCVLVRLRPDAHVIIVTTHHLVCDGWSMGVLTKEFSSLYAAALEGLPAPLPDLPYHYVDFARWQREWLAGPAAALQLAYWREQLAPPLPNLLPVEAHEEYLSIRRQRRFVVAAEVADVARRVARQEGSTLFAAMLAAWSLVLSARTGQSDVRVATFASGRGRTGAEHVVGLFSNLVCLRTRVERSMRFTALVRAVQRAIADATAHEDLPFDVVARELQPALAAAGSRLFQVLVLWQALPAETLRIASVAPSLYRTDEDEAVVVQNPLDLKFELVETPGALNGTIAWKQARFTAAGIQELLDALDRCLTLVDRDRTIGVGALCEALVRGGLTHADASDAPGVEAGGSRQSA